MYNVVSMRYHRALVRGGAEELRSCRSRTFLGFNKVKSPGKNSFITIRKVWLQEFQNPNEGPALPCLPKYLVSAFDSTQYVSSRKRMVLDWHHLNLDFKRGLVKSVVYVYFLQIKVELIFEGKNLFVLKVLKDSSIWQ